jgi:hypothetical protein
MADPLDPRVAAAVAATQAGVQPSRSTMLLFAQTIDTTPEPQEDPR